MATATLEEKTNEQFSNRDVNISDHDVLMHLKKLDDLAIEGSIPDITSIPLVNSPEKYLKPEHYKLLLQEGRSYEEMRIIATIALMTPLLRKVLDINYGHKKEFLKDYLTSQTGWMLTAYRMEAHGRDISQMSEEEKYNSYFKKGTPRVYKLFFCLKHPDKVSRLDEVEPILAKPVWDEST